MDSYLHCIFCDDVRQELSGKYSLIGCYGADLFVPTLPFKISKLFVVITLAIPIEKKPSSLKITIKAKEAEVARIEINCDFVKQLTEKALIDNPDSSRIHINGINSLDDFVIDEPCSLSVCATIDNTEIVGPKLRIKQVIPAPALS